MIIVRYVGYFTWSVEDALTTLDQKVTVLFKKKVTVCVERFLFLSSGHET